MSDTDAAVTGFQPVPLHGASYNLQDLLRESEHAAGLKTEEGQSRRLAEMSERCVADPAEFAARTAPIAPADHVITDIVDAQGNRTQAAVQLTHPLDDDAAALARGETPTPPQTDDDPDAEEQEDAEEEQPVEKDEPAAAAPAKRSRARTTA